MIVFTVRLRAARTLLHGWCGSIWPCRRHRVVWTSAAACLLAVMGLVLADGDQAPGAFSAGEGDPVFRMVALALHHRCGLWRLHGDLGVQRAPVDGCRARGNSTSEARCRDFSGTATRLYCEEAGVAFDTAQLTKNSARVPTWRYPHSLPLSPVGSRAGACRRARGRSPLPRARTWRASRRHAGSADATLIAIPPTPRTMTAMSHSGRL